MNKHQQAFIDLLNNKEKVAVLMAPSFVVDFSYPEIILMLKDLGVALVTEITYGAYLVNQIYNHYIAQNPQQKYYINTTCPVIVDFIHKQYPNLSKYLLPEISCVMAFIKYFHTIKTDYKIVFVSPCLVKRELEQKRIKEWTLSLTFQELAEIFQFFQIKKEKYKGLKAHWDELYRIDTKLYPIEGALTLTAKWKDIFPDYEIIIGSTLPELKKYLEQIEAGTLNKALIDFTACKNSCINGPGIINKNLEIAERKEKVYKYYKSF